MPHSVMLPAYFATSFGWRRALVAMTFVFAAGVAAVVVPIALGASWLSAAISGHHRVVFAAAALAMMAMGVAALWGWKPALPMIGMRARSERGRRPAEPPRMPGGWRRTAGEP